MRRVGQEGAYDGAHGECCGVVAVPAIQVDRDVDVDYITILKRASMCFGERYVRKSSLIRRGYIRGTCLVFHVRQCCSPALRLETKGRREKEQAYTCTYRFRESFVA